jgi:hypothetical protein
LLARIHLLATVAWAGVAAGAGLGFLARDLAGLSQPWVALAWTAGALFAVAPVAARRARRALPGERGQAAVEFTGLVLLASLGLGALGTFASGIDGRSFGGFLTHRVACAVKGGCHDGDRALVRAYGEPTASLVRAHAPGFVYERGELQIPVDWRRCRGRICAEARDGRDLDVHRSRTGERATAFTRVLRRRGRTYLQYWLYYVDSNTSSAGSGAAWDAAWLIPRASGVEPPAYPGFHRDDWEAYVIRLDADGSAWARASSHGRWTTCREKDCAGDWIARTGWTRVSRGSHGGHIPVRSELRRAGRQVNPREAQLPVPGAPVRLHHTPLLPGHELDERTTTGEGIRLIPLETHHTGRYRAHDDAVEPPWRKEAYRDPDSDES